jgi:hypothetical protein
MVEDVHAAGCHRAHRQFLVPGGDTQLAYDVKRCSERATSYASGTPPRSGVSGRVARPFGFALTDPGRRLSRTRLFPEVTRIGPCLVSRDA